MGAVPDQSGGGDPQEGSVAGQSPDGPAARTQLPLLPALLRAVEQHRTTAAECLNTATAAPTGGEFTAGGRELQRCRQGASGRVYAIDVATIKRRDLTHEESAAFWSWATVEVLRHTGIRIEEMLELTHHSFVAYTLPTTGEVVPMLQVAPSKTDAERLLPVSPELAEVLTAIIFRVRAGKASLPLVSAYDVFEQTWSPPVPYLFQRRFGTEDRPLTRSHRCHPFRAAPAHRSQGLRTLHCGHHDGIRCDLLRGRHRAPPVVHRTPRGRTAQRGIPQPHQPRMERVPRPLRTAESRSRNMRTRPRNPFARMKTPAVNGASDAHYFESTQLKCRDWKGSTPTSATGCGKPENRAG
jgi:hypothetical protein